MDLIVPIIIIFVLTAGLIIKSTRFITIWLLGLFFFMIDQKISGRYGQRLYFYIFLWTIFVISLKIISYSLRRSVVKESDDKKEKGNRFEKEFDEKIIDFDRTNFHGKGKTVRNIYVPKEDGTYTELDIVWISQKGIAVIECKNFGGWIYGNAADEKWIQAWSSHSEEFYNPIKQNENHIKFLREYLGSQYPYFSFVVFSDSSELKNISVSRSSYEGELLWVGKANKWWNSARETMRNRETVLSKEQIVELYEKLLPLKELPEGETEIIICT